MLRMPGCWSASRWLAASVGVIGLLTGAWNAVENASVDARFSLRPVHHPHNLVVVGIDEKTLDATQRALAVSALPRRARDRSAARRPRPHDRLRRAVHQADGRSPGLRPVSRGRARGQRRARHHRSGIARRCRRAGGPQRPRPRQRHRGRRRLQRQLQRRDPAVPVLGRRPATRSPWRPPKSRSGVRRPSSSFRDGSAWIDFPGPVGTVTNVSFVDLIHGRVPPAELAGKIVVVGPDQPGAAGHPRDLGDLQHGHVGPGSAGRCDRDGAGRQPAAPDAAVGGA